MVTVSTYEAAQEGGSDSASSGYSDYDVGTRYPTGMHRMGSKGCTSTPPTQTAPTLPPPRRRIVRRRIKIAQRGLDPTRLPESLLQPPQRHAYPEPLMPFPPSVALPLQRKVSVDKRFTATRRLMDTENTIKAQSDTTGMRAGDVLLQHTVEWEEAKRHDIEWEEAKDFQRFEATWGRYRHKCYNDIKRALEFVQNEERLADIRHFKERDRLLYDEAAARDALAKFAKSKYSGILHSWDKLVMQHISSARVLIQRTQRRHAKSVMNFMKAESGERNETHKQERLERVSVERAAARAINTLKQELFIKAHEDKREEQMNRAATTTQRSHPVTSPGVTQCSTRTRYTKSVVEHCCELEEEHQRVAVQHLVNREEDARRHVLLAEYSGFNLVLFAQERATQAGDAADMARRAKDKARTILLCEAALHACCQEEGKDRTTLLIASTDAYSGIIRKERRNAHRLMKADEAMKKRHHIHQRKMAQAQSRTLIQQSQVLERISRQQEVQGLTLEEHHAREEIAVDAFDDLDRVLNAERRARHKAVVSAEKKRRIHIDTKEANLRKELKIRMRQGLEFISRCTMTLDSLSVRMQRCASQQQKSQRLHVQGCERVQRDEITKLETVTRVTVEKHFRADGITVSERHVASTVSKVQKESVVRKRDHVSFKEMQQRDLRRQHLARLESQEARLRDGVAAEEKYLRVAMRDDYLVDMDEEGDEVEFVDGSE